MTPERFFELMLIELQQRPEMQSYYKFLGNESSFHFRKNYFLERLRYIYEQLNDLTGKDIWDCGCGYGTTALFLAMNDVPVHGTTLEFYYPVIKQRVAYWQQFGKAELFTYSYENLFDNQPQPDSYDWIIVQDTLHHLEPIDQALQIFHQTLRKEGKLLAIEENGNNLIQRIKLYKYRGNKRIITYWDEKLQKDILMGNENIRPLGSWRNLFRKAGFRLAENSVSFVRYYLPFYYRLKNEDILLERERFMQIHSRMRREWFFFGLNFIAEKG